MLPSLRHSDAELKEKSKEKAKEKAKEKIVREREGEIFTI
jgi:hypothetical protein